MSDRLSVLPQYLMPKRAMTVFAGHCAGSQTAWWTRNVIPWFIRRYGVDMNEAADSNPANYPTFNAFFTPGLEGRAYGRWPTPRWSARWTARSASSAR